MAQPPAQPPATQIPTPILWQCHVCKNEGPIKYAFLKKCATCGHDVCDLCKKDDDIPSPMGSATARVRSMPIVRGIHWGTHAQEPNIWPTPQFSRLGIPNIRTHGRATHNHKLTSRPNRPSSREWWRCSECRNVNNPALTDRHCTSCNHIKCASCTAICSR